MKKNSIVVCRPTRDSIKKVSEILDNGHFKWVYFGETVSKSIALEMWIGYEGERIDIAEILQKTANDARQPYIDYMGRLSLKNDSLLWWASSFSEKNPFISKTFLYLCYVKTALSLVESRNQENIVFYVENKAVSASLVENLSALGYDVVNVAPRLEGLFGPAMDLMEFIIKVGWFVLNNVYRILLTQNLYHLNNPKFNVTKNKVPDSLTLIHTWVDQRSFTGDGTFYDSYFGSLKDHLKKKGKNVVIVPYILHTVPYSKAIKKLVNLEDNFLVPSAFLKLTNILQVLKATIKKPSNKRYPLFEGVDISYLIYHDYLSDWKDTRMRSNLLYYYFIKNWKDKGIPVERFIYTYENHTLEKIFCTAFREFYPHTTVVGYQHAALSKMYLNFFISENERDIFPFPDKLITLGKYTMDVLVSSGYIPIKLICGGAIRYEYLFKTLNQPFSPDKPDEHKNAYDILVTSSIDRNEASELILKALKAFESLDEYNVILKCHPVMSYERIAKGVGISSLPENFSVSTVAMSSLLDDCDLLLYTSSTTSVEALAAGVPILQVGSNFIIDRDILDSHLRLSALTVEEIRIKARQLLEMDPDDSYKKKINAKEIARTFFGQVDDSVFDLFLTKK